MTSPGVPQAETPQTRREAKKDRTTRATQRSKTPLARANNAKERTPRLTDRLEAEQKKESRLGGTESEGRKAQEKEVDQGDLPNPNFDAALRSPSSLSGKTPLAPTGGTETQG